MKRNPLVWLTGAVLLGGCTDESPISPNNSSGSSKVSVQFQELADCQGCDFVVVFSSAADGTVHDLQFRTNEPRIGIEVPSSSSDGYFVSTIYKQSNSPTTNIETTHHYHASETIERQLGSGSCSGGPVNLQFINIPNHRGYSLGASPCLLGVNDADPLGPDKSIWAYRSPLDLLLTLDLIDAPRSYVWLRDLVGWSDHQFDLSAATPFETHSIEIQAAPRDVYVTVAAWADEQVADPEYKFFPLWAQKIPQAVESAELQVKSADFVRYEMTASTSTWSPSTAPHTTKKLTVKSEGTLPRTLSFWDGEIEVLRSRPNNFLIDVVDGAERILIRWASTEVSTHWTIDFPVSEDVTSLPLLPEAMQTIYPYLDRRGLGLWSITASRRSESETGNGDKVKVLQTSQLF